MSVSLSSHVLDQDAGRPAVGLLIVLCDSRGSELTRAWTNDDGRVSAWPGVAGLTAGEYELRFETAAWYAAREETCFYPEVSVRFVASGGHYHVPLLLNRHGYSTYRGS
ncbi:MAG: hydroxyisourate hydrolase [Pseudomonadota bacterium]